MLEYSGIGFENRTMVMPKPEWLEMKQSLGFDFPNLPYYQVCHGSNFKLSVNICCTGRGPQAHPKHGDCQASRSEVQFGRTDRS